MLRTVVNTLVAPQVEKFVFQHALKTSPEELLRGATHAANTISDELKNGRHDLQARKFVDATCQKSLMRDLAAARRDRPNALRPKWRGATPQCSYGRRTGPRRLREGARAAAANRIRRLFGSRGRRRASSSTQQSTQERLLAQYGATVQAEVVFDEGFPVDAKHHAACAFETFIPSRVRTRISTTTTRTCVDVNGVAAATRNRRAQPSNALFDQGARGSSRA